MSANRVLLCEASVLDFLGLDLRMDPILYGLKAFASFSILKANEENQRLGLQTDWIRNEYEHICFRVLF